MTHYHVGQISDTDVSLFIAKAERGDSGQYTVTLRNTSGQATASVSVNVLG